MKTQNDAILAWLQAGHSLTPLEALTRFGSLRLGARIYELKKEGHNIQKETIAVGEGKHVAKYFLVKETMQAA
jgi:hypothetical protein